MSIATCALGGKAKAMAFRANPEQTESFAMTYLLKK
tara:strand:- start:484 stop:591 length:108 start_codon:yes stop_codon:yes gene_type:complete